jgi:hypothetical protein
MIQKMLKPNKILFNLLRLLIKYYFYINDIA